MWFNGNHNLCNDRFGLASRHKHVDFFHKVLPKSGHFSLEKNAAIGFCHSVANIFLSIGIPHSDGCSNETVIVISLKSIPIRLNYYS